MVAIRDGRSAVTQQDMMDAISRLDKKRTQGSSATSPETSTLEDTRRTFKDPSRAKGHGFSIG